MNKFLCVTLFTWFILMNGVGQETKFIITDYLYSHEEYSVLKSNKKIKHGDFLVMSKLPNGNLSFDSIGNYNMGLKNGLWKIYYKSNNNIKESGNYVNGKREGVWFYYYPQNVYRKLEIINTNAGTSMEIMDDHPIICSKGLYVDGFYKGVWDFVSIEDTLRIKYDFDTDSLLYPHYELNYNSEPILFADSTKLMDFIYSTFDFNNVFNAIGSKGSLEEAKIVFRFTIDEKSKVKNVELIENTIKNKKLYNRALETIKQLNNIWLPKYVNGRPSSSLKIIRFILHVQNRYDHKIDASSSTIYISKNFHFLVEVD